MLLKIHLSLDAVGLKGTSSKGGWEEEARRIAEDTALITVILIPTKQPERVAEVRERSGYTVMNGKCVRSRVCLSQYVRLVWLLVKFAVIALIQISTVSTRDVYVSNISNDVHLR